MELFGRDWSYPTLLLGGLVVVSVMTLIVAASTSGAAFGTYNPAWDGASDLRAVADNLDVDHEVILNTSAYEQTPPNETVAFILSPERGYGSRDEARVRQFVRNGGTVVIAEDYGAYGNDLLGGLNASARFNGSVVRDERYNYRSPALPVAPNVTNHSLTRDVSQLTLNRGTVIDPNTATVVVRTSDFAYLDLDQDGELDTTESLHRRPVVTTEQVGAGQVIAVSDPSLFINAMLDRPGNRQFVRNLLTAHERAVFDYSHAGRQPPLTVAVLWFRDSLLGQIGSGVLGVGVIAFWVRRPTEDVNEGTTAQTGTSASPIDEDVLLAYLRRHHPEWEESRLRRVMRGIFTDDQ